MRTRNARRAVVTTLGVVAASFAAVGQATADPSSSGCPAGYSVLAVADLAPQGYQVPGRVDDPESGILSFGQPGNGDGLVCGVALGNQTTPWGGQIYNFWDNTLSR